MEASLFAPLVIMRGYSEKVPLGVPRSKSRRFQTQKLFLNSLYINQRVFAGLSGRNGGQRSLRGH